MMNEAIQNLVDRELLIFGGQVSMLPINRVIFEKRATESVAMPDTMLDNLSEIMQATAIGAEENTIDNFISPILNLLGFNKQYRLRNTGVSERRPDLIYYDNADNCREGSENNSLIGIYTIVEAKPYNEKLDKHQKQLRDYLDSFYAKSENAIRWGILTNGYEWRLYRYGKTGYLGFDLKGIFVQDIDNGLRKQAVELFYKYFRREAFEDNASFLNGIDKQAQEAQEKVKEELHKQAYPALLAVFNGFLRALRRRNGELDENAIKAAHEDSIYFIYRLIFLLYSKGRELSFVKKLPDITGDDVEIAPVEIRDRQIIFHDSQENYSMEATSSFESKLYDIFQWMNAGNEFKEIPQYNGGLFKKRKIDNIRLDDWTVSVALKLLLYSPNGDKLDYGNLDVQHLGNIYERLLLFDVPRTAMEYDFCYAGRAGTTGGSYITIKFPFEWTFFDVDDAKRKSTGTYYTPDYIVQYIVKHTIGEKLEEIAENIDGELKIKTDRPLEKILNLKILDPAMGSGHFLIRAIDYIAGFISENIGDVELKDGSQNIECSFGTINELVKSLFGEWENFDEIKEKISGLKASEFWARVVAKRCIYGVDINNFAVELAKLAIWLHTFNENEPLQFLDHHIKCGNSLIGFFDLEEINLPETQRFSQFVNAVKAMATISANPDLNVEDVKRAEKEFIEINKQIEPFLLHSHVALAARNFMDFDRQESDLDTVIGELERIAFEVGIPREEQESLSQERNEQRTLFDTDPVEEVDEQYRPTQSQIELVKKAISIAEEKQFFHWKLQFPEVWFKTVEDSGAPELAEGGFDVVIGNPPWGAKLEREEKDYLIEKEMLNSSTLNTAYIHWTR